MPNEGSRVRATRGNLREEFRGDFEPSFLQAVQNLGREFSNLRAAFSNVEYRARLERLTLGYPSRQIRRAGCSILCLLFSRERQPGGLTDEEFKERGLLMPSRKIIVELPDFIETQVRINRRYGKFCRIEISVLKRCMKLIMGDQLRVHAEFLQDLGAETKGSHLETAKIFDLSNFPAEPATSFRCHRPAKL